MSAVSQCTVEMSGFLLAFYFFPANSRGGRRKALPRKLFLLVQLGNVHIIYRVYIYICFAVLNEHAVYIIYMYASDYII